MSDYISRRSVMELVQFMPAKGGPIGIVPTKAVLQIPAADVRPVVRGRWVWDPDGLDWGLGCWVCNQCHSRNANIPAQKDMKPLDWAGSKFCPECGTDMREGRVKDE